VAYPGMRERECFLSTERLDRLLWSLLIAGTKLCV